MCFVVDLPAKYNLPILLVSIPKDEATSLSCFKLSLYAISGAGV